jgi:hypothetical protein
MVVHLFVTKSFLPSVDGGIAYAARSNCGVIPLDSLYYSLLFKVSECVSCDQPFTLQVLAIEHLSQTQSFKAWL